MGYSLRAPSPPLHLKTIMSFILCLTKKENSICVCITLREVVMIATKWLLSRRGGRDKEVERSAGAASVHIIGVFVFVCAHVCVCNGRGRGDTLVVSCQLEKAVHCGSVYSTWVCFCPILCLHAFNHISLSLHRCLLHLKLWSFFIHRYYLSFCLSQACSSFVLYAILDLTHSAPFT